ncbi:dual specificity protein phosphatase 12 [Rostrohypoxylon terebratum]|nr:dual specificity protein phosphatase 12 [Rostrohypoxylon terebratum]
MSLYRVPGPDNLYVGGLWILNTDSGREKLRNSGITHILSAIKYSLEAWGEEVKRYKHLSIDVDDDVDEDLLVHFPSAVRFIDSGLYPPSPSDIDDKPPTGVYVHCAMGISRSVSCVIAFILHKYPHRFGAAQRRQNSKDAVKSALELVRQARPGAEPNSGFLLQLELWWEMGCPADDENSVEQHPIYQKWLYDRMLRENRDVHEAPKAEDIRFEDELESGREIPEAEINPKGGKEIRCKKCRRILATPKFVVLHAPIGRDEPSNCAHVFIETLSWMRPMLEDGALEGRLSCPNAKCGATVGRFAWQGLKCSCSEWVVPAFSLNRSRVDEVVLRHTGAPAIRLPPGRNGHL